MEKEPEQAEIRVEKEDAVEERQSAVLQAKKTKTERKRSRSVTRREEEPEEQEVRVQKRERRSRSVGINDRVEVLEITPRLTQEDQQEMQYVSRRLF